MQYGLIVSSDRDANLPARRALAFARQLNVRGHQLRQVFFYARGVDGVLSAPLPEWSEVNLAPEGELVLCSASADRLGVETAPDGYVIAGLGALVEAGVEVDRIVSFV